MSEFKVGDKVEIIKRTFSGDLPLGSKYTIEKIIPDSKNPYILGISLSEYASAYSEDQLKLISRGKELPVKYAVFYEENDIDPMKTFTTDKELKKWLAEAQKDEDIDFSSIRVFEVKKELKVETSFKLVS